MLQGWSLNRGGALCEFHLFPQQVFWARDSQSTGEDGVTKRDHTTIVSDWWNMMVSTLMQASVDINVTKKVL